MDRKLAALEKKISREYKAALETVKERANKYLKAFDRLDAQNLALFRSGVISYSEYLHLREVMIMQGTGWVGLRDAIANDLVSTDRKAVSLIRGFLPEAYAESINFATYEIEQGTKLALSFSLYSREAVEALMRGDPRVLPLPNLNISKDLRWNRQKITSAMVQGILAGDSIPHLANRLKQVTDMDDRAAIRNARTWTTAAEGKGRFDGYKRAQSKGINIAKQWIATHDNRTRMSHALIDGEICELDEEFANGLMFPGDADGPPEEICNCRCTMMSVLKDYDFVGYDHEFDADAYEEWKAEQDYEG